MNQKTENKKKYMIDVAGKSLGRVARDIALLLRGKNSPTFAYNKDSNNIVEVMNTDLLKLTGNKLDQKKYYKHTGYVGNLKTKYLKDLMKEDSGEVLKKAVMGMLPKNKLRARAIKRLILNKLSDKND